MKRTTFLSDSEFGEAWEQKFIESLTFEKYISYRKIDGKCKEFDFIVCRDDVITLYEIKSDRYAHNTGNLVVEFYCRGKDSGIRTSLADIWVFIIDATGEVFEVPKKVLEEAIHRQEYSEIREIAEGNLGFFFPVEYFRPFYSKTL